MRTKIITTPERSRLMARVRQKGTSAEITVRSILNDLSIIYETNVNDLPGSPDLVNRDNKWAIFVHGCYWHAHEGCERGKLPTRNQKYWKDKFQKNIERDRNKKALLESDGYNVIVVWECELKDDIKIRKRLQHFFSINECYKFSESKKSVVRIVHSKNGIYQSARIFLHRLDITGLNAKSAFDQAFLRKRIHPNWKINEEIIRSVDLFSGCGGLSLGAMEACRAIGKQFLSVAAVDNNNSSLNVYNSNINCENTFLTDIKKLIDGELNTDITTNERQFLDKIMPVELLLAGPPCKGYSDLNNHKRRDDPRNFLYQRVTRFIEIAKPKHVIVENVPSVSHGKNGEVNEAVRLLKNLKYYVDVDVVDLSKIGVPQKRNRHILLGSKTKILSIKDIIEKYRVIKERTLNWAIFDLIDVEPRSMYDMSSRHSKENLMRIKYLHDNNLYNLPNDKRPLCHQDGKHSYKSMYGRMRPDEPAQTITSGFGSPGQGRYIHPVKYCTITPHEAARIQFFPDFYNFKSIKGKTEMSEMIGNAVPMKTSYIFCLELLR